MSQNNIFEGVELSNNGTHLSLVGKDLDHVPKNIHSHFGSSIESLDLSFNNITYVSFGYGAIAISVFVTKHFY